MIFFIILFLFFFILVKYNLRRQPSSSTQSDLSQTATPSSGQNQGEVVDDIHIKLESDKSSIDIEMYGSYSSDASLQSDSNTLAAATTTTSDSQEPSTSGSVLASKVPSNPTALIALQQLASISSAQCMERLVPILPKDLLAQNESLLYARSPGKRLPRQGTKRLSQYETNRCPLCSRVYRSQAFLNEHMRKEHSILI